MMTSGEHQAELDEHGARMADSLRRIDEALDRLRELRGERRARPSPALRVIEGGQTDRPRP